MRRLYRGIVQMYNMVVVMSLCIAATCSFSACFNDSDGPEPSKEDPAYAQSRTVLVYMAAENSLDNKVTGDVAEMLAGMRDETLYAGDRLVLYVDDVTLPRLYLIDKNTQARSLSEMTPVVKYEEDVNSASANELEKVLKQVKTLWPAESYGLVMWSHSTGWIPSTNAEDMVSVQAKQRRSFGVDNCMNVSYEPSNGGRQMDIRYMARALEKAGGVDFILFDACVMQSMEVVYELRHATKYVLGSPAEIPGPGAFYTTMVKAMFKQDNYDKEMLQAYYDYYTKVNNSYGLVISSVKTSALSDFAAYMKTVIAAHRDDFLTANYNKALNYLRFAWTNYLYPDMYDAQGIMKVVLSADEFTRWKQEVAKVVTCKHATGWYSGYNQRLNSIDDEQCCGVSMYVPCSVYEQSRLNLNEYYFTLDWGQNVWGE